MQRKINIPAEIETHNHWFNAARNVRYKLTRTANF